MKKLLIAPILFFCTHSFVNAQLSCTGLTQVDFTIPGAPQTFTVPAGVTSIIIKTRGATGGLAPTPNNSAGGGAIIEGQYTVVPGQTVTILVGGRGTNGNDFEAAGGGATGVYIAGVLKLVAGGGGGEDNTGNGGNGQAGTAGSGTTGDNANTCGCNNPNNGIGGTGGAGGNHGEFACGTCTNGGGGGGGLNSAGQGNGNANAGRPGGQGNIAGAAGGLGSADDAVGVNGGWGWAGGGGADDRESGGGGGYSGGGGAPEGFNPGGGGSFSDPVNRTAFFSAAGTSTTTAADGLVSICYSSPSLPLLLLSFSGSSKETYNLIKWTTAEESDLNKFQVERSVDGRNFSVIGELPPTNNNRGNTYEFRDNNIAGYAVLYYRLRIVENDGSSSFSFIISIKARGQSQNFTIYPNPVKDKLTIGSNTPLIKIEIINALGEIVYANKKVNLTIPVSVSHLSKGVYIIKAFTEAGIVSEKFIKN